MPFALKGLGAMVFITKPARDSIHELTWPTMFSSHIPSVASRAECFVSPALLKRHNDHTEKDVA